MLKRTLKSFYFAVFLLDLLAEHLLEIRALRQRLEESIRTNDRLREQLERRLAEVEKDPGRPAKLECWVILFLLWSLIHYVSYFCYFGTTATNIFIHGNEEQGQLANEVQFLWGQNQALKERLNVGSRGKTTCVTT